ncbi:helix-hairpin-helix domain-containing protein [Candidatus Phytoplasma sacchari]|uniref:DNA-directed DNA polymerase n=1 Tax=Candidatus Phytoplasma sacchari TaxID=2609813 RepID=A0ABY7M0Y1_9MOLU|nr:PHP domain-containing protein [Candidatus Phytoplasma sacchari]
MLGVFYLQTFYSIMQSIHSIESLVKKSKKSGYDFVALSEDENLYSMIFFLDLCDKYKIKPIIGMKFYLFLDLHFDRKKIGILVYSFNNKGVNNLIKISNFIKNKNKYITLKDILIFQEGNFFILSNIEFYFSNILEIKIIKDILIILKNNINNFFLGFSLQSDFLEIFANVFLSLAEELDLKVVPVHKTNYLEKNEKEVYELLFKLSNQKIEKDFNFNFLNKEKIKEYYQFYFDNYKKNFLDLKYFIQKIKYEKIFSNSILALPFNKPDKPYQYLKKIVFEQLQNKISVKSNNFHLYTERLLKELKIIQKKSYEKYFLIIYDLISYAKNKKILVGPGRGSSASSLICFLLGITEIDPVLYNLIFERFLNLYRKTMPDIDLDFPDEKLYLIHKYIIKKYNINNVANISTFTTFTIKSIINNIDFNYIKIEKNDLKKINKLEGIPKFIGTHPAGVIISKYDLFEFLPVQKNLRSNTSFLYQTQFDSKQLTQIGFNKIDLLSLKSLTFIEKILKKIKKDIEIDWKKIPLKDFETFCTLQKGDTDYIFQLESKNAKSILKKVFPKNIEDLSDVLSLNRPGPFYFLNVYLEYKKNKVKKIIDESIDFIIIPTNGIILYQEQIMEIAFYFAGYDLGEAEIFMKSITNKKENKIKNDYIKENFIKKSQKKGRNLILSKKIYNYIFQFANYTFNKSHSLSYSLISYRMTYLKTHYYLFFFMVILDDYIKNNKITFNIIREIKIKKKTFFLKPDIFKSTAEYQLLDNNKIILPLTIIKDLSQDICKFLIKEREKRKFDDFDDFKKRCKNVLNNNILKNLIFSGALDNFGLKRKTLFQNANLDFIEYEQYLTPFKKKIEKEIEYSSEKLKEKSIEVLGFFLDDFNF